MDHGIGVGVCKEGAEEDEACDDHGGAFREAQQEDGYSGGEMAYGQLPSSELPEGEEAKGDEGHCLTRRTERVVEAHTGAADVQKLFGSIGIDANQETDDAPCARNTVPRWIAQHRLFSLDVRLRFRRLDGLFAVGEVKGDEDGKLDGIDDNEKDEPMLHATVTVDITYGECNIPAGKENFHVRFIRPLDINFQGQGINEESAVDGANVEIAKFINGITDWNHQRVIVPEKDSTGAETGYYTANVIKTVDMYAYYQFDSLIINIGLAERDNWNVKDTAEYKAIKDVTPAVKLQLGTLDEDEVFTAMTPDTDEDGNEFYAVDIADFDSIKDLVINYRNDEAYVEAFNIRIPIKIGYAWGYYVAYFEINILDTGSTTPKKPAR